MTYEALHYLLWLLLRHPLLQLSLSLLCSSHNSLIEHGEGSFSPGTFIIAVPSAYNLCPTSLHG